MRIAHLSDLHFGSPKTLAEVERCTAFAIDAAVDAGAELAVISGDSTDHAIDVHSPSFVALARLVRRLADHCPVLMLQGTYSHEPPGTLDVFRLLGGRFPVHVADRIHQVAWCGPRGWVASNSWRFDDMPAGAQVLLSCVPTVNKATVAAAVGTQAAAEAVGQHLVALLAGFGEINAQAAAAGVPTVGVSHGTVSGCVTEHGVPMAGLDHEFTTGSLFAAQAAAFMLGHIHKHQAWEQGGRVIAYPGSIGRLHYGEEDAKGCLLWDVSPIGASFRFIETPARRMLHLTFNGRPDMDAVRAAASDAAGAFVRVRWQIAEEERASVDRAEIERLLAGAAELRLEGRVVPLLRARAAGISAAPTLADKLRRWAALAGVDGEPLVERLAWLQATPPDEISRAVLTDLAELAGTAAERQPCSRPPERVQIMADLFGEQNC
ncbi:MAG TPA: metallophosphatase family protein [Aquabacterium sp.]|nr:metallophosphatase family protein [Aquabacterium sp.]